MQRFKSRLFIFVGFMGVLYGSFHYSSIKVIISIAFVGLYSFLSYALCKDSTVFAKFSKSDKIGIFIITGIVVLGYVILSIEVLKYIF